MASLIVSTSAPDSAVVSLQDEGAAMPIASAAGASDAAAPYNGEEADGSADSEGDEAEGAKEAVASAAVVTEEGRPIKPRRPKGPKGARCVLCKMMYYVPFSDHFATEHAHFHRRAEEVIGDARELFANGLPTLGAALSETFGALIRDDVAPSDAGEAAFCYALAAREQLSHLILKRLPTCKAFIFGSAVSMGSWDGRGDIDLTLLDPEGWEAGTLATSKPLQVDRVRTFGAACVAGGFKRSDLKLITGARVPILKYASPCKVSTPQSISREGPSVLHVNFDRQHVPPDVDAVESYFVALSATAMRWSDPFTVLVSFATGVEAVEQYASAHAALPPHTVCWGPLETAPEMFGIDFDISSFPFGVRNSWLLRAYMAQSSLVRAGSVFLKHWSKASAVNNSPMGYLTSYAVNILWVFYLLRRGLVSFVDPQSVDGSPQNAPVAGTYVPLLDPQERDSAEFLRALADAVFGFFCYFAHEFDWESEVVSISREGVTKRAPAKNAPPSESGVHHASSASAHRLSFCGLSIEDPYEAGRDLGWKAVGVKGLKIYYEFCRAAVAAARGDFEAILRPTTVAAAMRRLIVLFPPAMLARGGAATVDEVLADIAASEPDVLAAAEAEVSVSQLPRRGKLVVQQE